MKLLFIVPPYLSYEKFINPGFNERISKKKDKQFGSILSDVPLGIISISAYLKKHIEDIEIDFIDFNAELNKTLDFDYNSFKEYFKDFLITKKFNEKEYDLIGISAIFTPAYFNMLDLGKTLREIFAKSFIISGGGLATNLYKRIYAESDCFDALCYGEGEKPLLNLLLASNKEDYLKESSVWVLKDDVDKKYFHDFIEDLDEIPFVDYDLCNVDNYFSNTFQSLFPFMDQTNKCISYITTRGCIHKCCFCASHTVHGRKIREHSLERIEKDLTLLKEKYDVKVITFIDDHFMYDKKRVYAIVEILKKLNLRAFFPSSLALYALDKDILMALKSVGLDHIILSVESGSDRVLKKLMHKPLNLSIVEKVIKDCNDLDISTDISILIGLPGETKEDIKDAELFFKSISPSWYRFSVAAPLVGSEMLEICIEKNYIVEDYINCDYKTGVVETEEFNPEYLKNKLYEMNLEFNFVYNNDMSNNRYEHALQEFEHTIKITTKKHAFAYYYAAICYLNIGNTEKHKQYMNNYIDILKDSSFWRDYSLKFNLQNIKQEEK
jgi:radical SAM superfamily enzyme YgiQ (UPF0313 family)